MGLICDVCEREVDEVVWWNDFARRSQVYLARCHGQEERAELFDDVLVTASSIALGRAFVTRRIEA